MALVLHEFETVESFIVFFRIEQQIDGHFLGFGFTFRVGMLGKEVVKQTHGFVERVGTWDEAQTGIVEQGFFGQFLVEASGIGIIECAAGIFQLVGLGVARCQIIRGVLCQNIGVACHLLQVADGGLVVAFHHLANTHLIIGLTRHAACQVLRVDLIILQSLVVILLLEIGIGDNLRHLSLTFLVGLANILGTFLYHRLVIAFEVSDLHDIRRHHIGIVLMRTQAAEVVQSLIILLLNILDVSVIITCRILILAVIHHQAVEQRHGLVQVARLEIGIAHVELHLLSFVGCERHTIGLFVNGQSLFVFLALEQIVGIQEIGMTCPCATWIVVHKLHDFGRAVGMTEIERADRLVILRIDATLRLGIGSLSAVLGKCGKSSTIFLVLKEQNAIVEKGFRIVVFDMLLR